MAKKNNSNNNQPAPNQLAQNQVVQSGGNFGFQSPARQRLEQSRDAAERRKEESRQRDADRAGEIDDLKFETKRYEIEAKEQIKRDEIDREITRLRKLKGLDGSFFPQRDDRIPPNWYERPEITPVTPQIPKGKPPQSNTGATFVMPSSTSPKAFDPTNGPQQNTLPDSFPADPSGGTSGHGLHGMPPRPPGSRSK